MWNLLLHWNLLFQVSIQIREILPLYSMGEILTHSNEEYNKAFYNIETSFICRK